VRTRYISLAVSSGLALATGLLCNRGVWADAAPENPAVYQTYLKSGADAVKDRGSGTFQLQIQTRDKVNKALNSGAISADEAAQFNTAIDEVNEKETWYRTGSDDVPTQVTDENVKRLNEISQKIATKIPKQTGTILQAKLNIEIHKAITEALGKKKITNDAATHFYSDLAEIEADMESLKNDPAASPNDVNELNGKLAALRKRIPN
jgi:hypothetical protein